MEFQTAETSLIGDREVNQDRHGILMSDAEVVLTACDGMGGHEDGEIAAQTAIDTFLAGFKEHKPALDAAPTFFKDVIEKAHRAVVRAGIKKPVDQRPRTTATLAMIAGNVAVWAHVGDSRVYHLRGNGVFNRTRDHSAVEALYQRGAITEAQMQTHPMRNFVEECLGGEADLPRIDIATPETLEAGDTLLLCTDGFWSPLDMNIVAERLSAAEDLQDELDALALEAREHAKPHSDNVTAVAFRLDE
ncbi:MAG TPA: protein phosphatase 2C domain-containing protein [Gammaproteobacteria bacterium]